MHYQTTYGEMPFTSGGVMVDNSVHWPQILAPSVANPSVLTAAPQHTVYPSTGCATFARPPVYQFAPGAPVPTAAEILPATTVANFFPEDSSVSDDRSPVPSSPSFCSESMTGHSALDSPGPSSSASQPGHAADQGVSLSHLVEQRNAMVANIPSNVSDDAQPSIQEQLKAIKPLLRKPIDTSKMNGRQVQRLLKRRERNKAAAEKCRIKRREKSSQIRQELSLLTRSNDELEQELSRLRGEMQELQHLICTHHCQIGHSKEDLTEMVACVVNPQS